MVNLDSIDDVGLVISKIMDKQSKSFQTSLKDFQVLLDEGKLEMVIVKNVLSIYNALETLHKEKKIDNQEFKQRTESLINIVQLVGDVNANHIHRRKP
ncbi:hypothetical protein [Sporosarcina sp. BP05]|uniref:hypothetical protein n=1 Tax=Sporosarcina sp. BP05 TaxID=2758726 RepID=UPI0016476C2E|nr:hypothetical protein [Sporosarcina sp. BP05]